VETWRHRVCWNKFQLSYVKLRTIARIRTCVLLLSVLVVVVVVVV